ncbi:MAG: hypothetical protein NT027_15785 [Proteobacteria bacterium]|nr:hypothetical protein [Pseudomonadota bacterium]
MSGIAVFQEQVKSRFDFFVKEIRKRTVGANNERLDLLVDSFYKLEGPQRNLVLGGGIAVLVLVVLGLVGLYFAQVNGLNRELNKRFDALYELRQMKSDFSKEDMRFNKLVEAVLGSAGGLRIKPYFEKIANDQNVQIEGLTETKVPLAADNPMSEKLQEVKVEMRLNNISLPRLLNFIVEVEKGSGTIRVQDLQIKSRFGTKLFFDAQLKGHGFIPLN